MVDEPIHDDSSYYEISITAGQAFLAVVLLIASLAAAFAFGIVVGEARGKTTVANRARPPVILEGDDQDRGRIEELGVVEEPFATPAEEGTTNVAGAFEEPEVIEDEPDDSRSRVESPAGSPELSIPDPASSPGMSAEAVPHVAQILSTTDQEPAERLAARLIEAGFTSAYVERVPGDAGMLYRVRVRFPSESAARGAVERLKSYAPGEIWVSRAAQ